jgi:hypothetical protein
MPAVAAAVARLHQLDREHDGDGASRLSQCEAMAKYRHGGPLDVNSRGCARKYGFLGRSAVVSSSLCYAQQLFKKAPFKMTFAGSNPPCPASQCGLSHAISGCVRTAIYRKAMVLFANRLPAGLFAVA